MQNNKVLIFIICVMLMQFSCKEPFEPILHTPQTGYLVVEGFINVNGITSIKLSRTQKVEQGSIKPELKANLQIVGENLVAYQVKEKDNGLYESDSMRLPNQKYQLKIKTAEGKQYESKLIEAKITPLIDRVSWKRDLNGVEINVNSHDDQNKTKYYKWTFDEAWEIHAAGNLLYKFVATFKPSVSLPVISIKNRTPSEIEEVYRCWKYNSSSQIFLGSSAKLTKDIISSPIVSIPNNSDRLGVLYSINVKQTSLDLDAYNFYLNLKSNTETNGSIFDRQPSETGGNITCIINPKEQVIGFIGINSLQEKRIYISSLPNWGYKFTCNQPILTIPNQQDSLIKYAATYQPVNLTYAPNPYSPPVIISLQISNTICVDCTKRGSNKKPFFWPN